MNALTVPTNEPGIGQVVRQAFPQNRKPINVQEFRGPMSLNSYWDEGSKDEFVFIDLAAGRRWIMPTSHPFFDRKPDGGRMGNIELSELPENVALVRGGYFRGKPSSVTVYLRADNMAKLLPAPQSVEISESARRALDVIGGTTSSYRAEEFARHQLGTYSANNSAVAELQSAGLVKINAAGAISVTIAGRNFRRSN